MGKNILNSSFVRHEITRIILINFKLQEMFNNKLVKEPVQLVYGDVSPPVDFPSLRLPPPAIVT